MAASLRDVSALKRRASPLGADKCSRVVPTYNFVFNIDSIGCCLPLQGHGHTHVHIVGGVQCGDQLASKLYKSRSDTAVHLENYYNHR